ncbi:phosphoribosylformylglycinamidine synthase [Butyricicoccus pullicaecorum]|uniref:Phosphoribosylformylglycinamidine synthase n=1 Tax=Butyricicoccus pullicaecorum 1.2 TaxID=1203606 RepID=R8W0N0_9FIRM|nr:phosphoribosylformylglycinamidine synthase [Butyricicoccus pullicaecorum]EOQ38495.1 phosphoribosylformylglycinamidine synthase [Butyricicoccus pullicaecorum 1.2]SKA53591.1 phosphoribosylformylglycinamidine synthase [Butyricicoccus pullicaecorum DSM 23266]
MAVYRCYSEKRPGFDVEAHGLFDSLHNLLEIEALTGVRYLCRYDVEGVDEAIYAKAKNIVFSEPMADVCYDETFPASEGAHTVLAVEPLPGQFDQRADSCAQCIQLMAQGERPVVAAAKVYVLEGELSDADLDKIRGYLINPVEAREASMDKPETLHAVYEIPTEVASVEGFIHMDTAALDEMQKSLGLAMDLDDLTFLQTYFRDEEHRDPTITEVRMVDTYWSDHCRHTTFLTQIDNVTFEDPMVQEAYDRYMAARVEVYGEEKAAKRPVTLMDIATAAAKVLKKRGYLKNLDESEEINACSIKVTVQVDGKPEEWLLMFKNETHNHPTEIEPFGGAATCLGGAIRDPLSGRSYVYQAMRVTGAGDPTVPLSETLPHKLPQRKLCTTAAAGYSSYGNQIGLATGLVHEFYHPGYVAKRMEIGAVVGAAPIENVIREVPEPGDIVILLGGKTGRDGCGGATGSSKKHTEASLETCGAEVQKGNPPEERKLQRLFRDPKVTRMIRRCNDFGAGGVSVAIGELADGLDIDLNAVPKKYDGLDGTELAISESQERMAVVVRAKDVDAFIAAAARENLEAVVVAKVTDLNRLRMTWNGKMIADVSRDFLNTNGCAKHADAIVPAMPIPDAANLPDGDTPREKILHQMSSLGICLERGLTERFDGSIGANSVFMPFGGKNQLTPAQVMAATLPALNGQCSTASVMAFGFDPYYTEQNPFLGASAAVVESVAKLVAAGCDYKTAYLTFQEYFERLGRDPHRFGKPLSALLGAYKAQEELCLAAIGGKDSMSGSFDDMDVPPTLVSFAIAPEEATNLISPEFKAAGHPVYLFDAPYTPDGAPDYQAIKPIWEEITDLIHSGKIVSAWALSVGGVSEAVCKMTIGNDIGFAFDDMFPSEALFLKNFGGLVVEATEELPAYWKIGTTIAQPEIVLGTETITLGELKNALEGTLESVFPTKAPASDDKLHTISYTERNVAAPAVKSAKPLAVIPVFPGTNCEYDTAKAVENAGGAAEIIVVRNFSADALAQSAAQLEEAIRRAQMVIIPGGFSGGDEPDGSGKFIASFLRNPGIKDAVHELLRKRDGLMLGICNGFQALIKLGLVPYGEIRDLDETCPTLTFNLIGRHQSSYVTTRVASVKSPWLSSCQVGDLHSIAISHGEGRFVAPQAEIERLEANGQIAFQYTDLAGNPSMDIAFNPNGSMCAIEGITSPDGRVLGKMGHTERFSPYVGKNIYGEKYQPIFENGVKYFK